MPNSVNTINTNIRHMLYEQKGGYLLVPTLIVIALGILALELPAIESSTPAIAEWTSGKAFLAPSDAGMAQLLLGAIAGSCVTVVSVIYSVLLIALTFASIQFSPRILTIFLKDRVSQLTLGVYIGTFAYCLIVLPHVQSGTTPIVPKLAVTLALILAIICVLYLILFIHHIALAIQANYIVDRIARETESVLKDQFGPPLKGFPREEETIAEPTGGTIVNSNKTGYIQYIDENKLLKLAIEHDVSIFIQRGIGQFLPRGIQYLSISPANRTTPKLAEDCLACVHTGPLRSMEDDVQFGMLQMVDIALKAISPAVNDPSTAISCVDHLTSILIVAATHEPPRSCVYDNAGALRLVRRQPTFERLLEIAFNQIMPYGKGDMAVSLRLMRALQDIAGVTNYPPYLEAIRAQAKRQVKACAACFPEEDCKELFARMEQIEKRQRVL
jgi:uncharacterized membrane protein